MSKLLFSLDKVTAKNLANLLKHKKLRRIYHGIYTDNLDLPLEKIVKKHWMEIIPYIVSKAILSYRTAIDLKPIPFRKDLDIVFLTSTYVKTIRLPGLIINVTKGNVAAYAEQVLPNLAKSNGPRMLLENLISIKKPEFKNVKTIGHEGVESYLARQLQFHGESWLNQVRDEAKIIAHELGFEREYNKLNHIISALLSTNDIGRLKTPYGIAVAKKNPYDEHRLRSFEKLKIYLEKCNFRERIFEFGSIAYKNLSFFESYFSNFIEGTEFIIDEAEDIVFKGKEIDHRHADSHAILANYYLAHDYLEMTRKAPSSAQEFINILKTRHAYLMKERPEKRPGEFKEIPNKAGNTYFVLPENVIGTLTNGFEIYSLFKDGLPKALFMHYLVSEVHPFNDGNGRLSRIMMNAELARAGLYKIIMPTVMRDNYLNALRCATKDEDFYMYCKVMDYAQAYTAIINWRDYGEAREKIEEDYANRLPDKGLPIFNRVLRILILSDLPR